jgi:adenine-specific DNA-methyltransferase
LTSPGEECPDYLAKQLITYIGNKRALLAPIAAAVATVQRRLGKSRLRMLDAFAGSGIVARCFKAHAEFLASNDIEDYAGVIGRCFLRNRGTVDLAELRRLTGELNRRAAAADMPPGFIAELYAPRDEGRIAPDDRVFYTRENARRLDDYRRLLESVAPGVRDLLLGPLLSQASIHANTAGVFKGFYKDRRTRVGRFGGSHSDALGRIKGTILLEPPVLSRFECEVAVFQEDANALARGLGGLDLAYFDPPYNQHPYGSNYFMLNLLVGYQRPASVSKVSGIPTHWRRSDYNVRARSLERLGELCRATDAKFLLVSFNDEGFIAPEELTQRLAELGRVEVMATPYNAYRGSRNLRNRPLHVTEHLFLVERK